MAKKQQAKVTYPESLVEAQASRSGAEPPSQTDRVGHYAHVGREVGALPPAEPAPPEE